MELVGRLSKTFDNLKTALTSDLTLTHYNPNKICGNYSFKMEFLWSKKMPNADGLSRLIPRIREPFEERYCFTDFWNGY